MCVMKTKTKTKPYLASSTSKFGPSFLSPFVKNSTCSSCQSCTLIDQNLKLDAKIEEKITRVYKKVF